MAETFCVDNALMFASFESNKASLCATLTSCLRFTGPSCLLQDFTCPVITNGSHGDSNTISLKPLKAKRVIYGRVLEKCHFGSKIQMASEKRRVNNQANALIGSIVIQSKDNNVVLSILMKIGKKEWTTCCRKI